MATSYFPLEPNFTSSLGLEKLSFSTGQAGSLSASLGLLFTLGIMVVIVTGAGALVYAGWQRIQPSQKAVTESNKTAKRAVLGTFGVVCLYVLLRTFNADLVSVNIGLEKLRGDGVGTTGLPRTNQQPATPSLTTGNSAGEKANRQSLQSAGISINKEPCAPNQVSDCTNVANLQPAVMSMLIQLKDSCPGSSITVTGGTEPGHQTHASGRAVDIRIGNEKLDACIKKFNSGPSLGFCKQTFSGMGGFVFCDENKVKEPHWHVYY